MPVGDISVFHYSGQWSPCDYYHRGFNQNWTGEPGEDFPAFTEKLVDFYKHGTSMPYKDEQTIRTSISMWHEAHHEAWMAITKDVVGNDRGDHERAFSVCPRTNDALRRWKNEEMRDTTHREKMSLMKTLLGYPKLFPFSLAFIAQVNGIKHPHNHPGLKITEDAWQSPKVSPTQTTSRRSTHSSEDKDDRRGGEGNNRKRGGLGSAQDSHNDHMQCESEQLIRKIQRLERELDKYNTGPCQSLADELPGQKRSVPLTKRRRV